MLRETVFLFLRPSSVSLREPPSPRGRPKTVCFRRRFPVNVQTPGYVIASQCAHWRGNPFPFSVVRFRRRLPVNVLLPVGQDKSCSYAKGAFYRSRGMTCHARDAVRIRISLIVMALLSAGNTDCHTSDLGHWFAMTHGEAHPYSPEPRGCYPVAVYRKNNRVKSAAARKPVPSAMRAAGRA